MSYCLRAVNSYHCSVSVITSVVFNSKKPYIQLYNMGRRNRRKKRADSRYNLMKREMYLRDLRWGFPIPFLLLLSGCFVVNFYWPQPPMSFDTFDGTNMSYSDEIKCMRQRCGRRTRVESVPPMSLQICILSCSSAELFLWPQPTGSVTLGNRSIAFNQRQITFKTVASQPVRRLLKRSYAHFTDHVATLVKNRDNRTDIKQFLIKVHVPLIDHRLKLATDESYHLTVRSEINARLVVRIKTKTFFGARHAMETLLQLIWWDEDGENGGVLKTLDGALVEDAPVFAYRGVMIDTGRNYIPVDGIKRVLVGMAANKLNVLHWHATDAQSFPLVLPRVPKLAQYGAYGPDMVYHPEDVKALVDFALVLGIRIILEVDIPAHVGNAWSWGPEEGLGVLALCINESATSSYCKEPPYGQLNPVNPNVYILLENIYSDIIEMTGETEIFHLGGDEVNFGSWVRHLQEEKWETRPGGLWADFVLQVLDRLQNANAGKPFLHVVFWMNDLSDRPYFYERLNRSDVVVQMWGSSISHEIRDRMVNENYTVIISHSDAWYLDCGFGKWREVGDISCSAYSPWQTVYSHRPWQHHNSHQIKLILGAEVCLWGEQVDGSSLDGKLWPRAAAFAERVWSDPYVDQISILPDVYLRLSTQRDRLVRKGVAADALWPMWCTLNPGMCL